ncbi:replication-relaxation family protein [Amycolatopsis pigmentata]|uniref:Replication-relaxation family protein n=1 Tax=Amycolatopsis pigmentata TaxID=450801 RepID=A0ABW5FK25_9PSEU
MISNPTPQRGLRGHKTTRPTPRAANTAEHQAMLAWRLTPRDKWIIRMLHEHRVLTIHQLTDLTFPSARAARMRLRELYAWRVVDRFQPFVSVGTAPMHYVLAPAGATVLAAEDGLDVKDLRYRHDRAYGIAHSLRLAHIVGVNEWFTALVAASRTSSGEEALTAWWSETRCARHFGDLVKPDGYGRWTNHGTEIEFFLEYDFGTEPLTKLAGKLTGYAALAASSGITTPVLVWLTTARREAAARRLLHRAWQTLDNPRSVPLATATADLLSPDATPSPAEEVWLPLDTVGGANARWTLHRLTAAWPHVPPANTPDKPGSDLEPMSDSPLVIAPAPRPMPPASSQAPSNPCR